MKKIGRVKAANGEFLERIKPEFLSWGLKPHVNPTSSFGRSAHGPRYDFCDLSDKQNVRLASFAIHSPEAILWIRGLRYGALDVPPSELPLLFDSMKNIFSLDRRWSIFRPLNRKWQADGAQDTRHSARKLFDEVQAELPRLKSYFYAD